MSERAQVVAGLIALVVLSIPAAISAGFLAPPGNDLLLHGHLAAGAAHTLTTQGWTAFQDPWFDGVGAGFPIFHHYPHLADSAAALLSVGTGLSPWTALSVLCVLAVLAVGPCAWLGARWLGLPPRWALLAGAVAVTMRSADPFGHALLCYGFNGHGLFGQLVGMVLASLAVPAWWRVTRPAGDLRQTVARGAVAAVLLSLVMRTSLPAGWISGVVLLALVLGEGRDDLRRRLGRATAVGAGAVVLSLGFLGPFLLDLRATGVYELVDPTHIGGFGAVSVLRQLFSGAYLDGAAPLPWTLPFLVALGAGVLTRPTREADRPLRGLAWAAVVCVLLLFGRATWGDWIGDIPLVGSFHDRRYLAGVHLVAPLLLALGAVRLHDRLTPDWRRTMLRATAGAVALAAALLCAQALSQVRSHAEFGPSWQAHRRQLDPSIQDLRESRLRVELAAVDGPIAGASLIDTLRMAGIPTAGKALHHYNLGRQGHMWWRFWLTSDESPRTTQPTGDDLFAFGAQALLVPGPALTGLTPAAHLPGGWKTRSVDPQVMTLLLPPARPDRMDDVGLVRSDLLIRSDSSELQGLPVAWHRSGAHAGGQFPSMHIRGVGPEPTGPWARTAHLSDRDPSVLLNLPTAAPGSLGRIESVARGPGPDRTVRLGSHLDGAWLLFGAAWHPRLRAHIDGLPVPVRLLLPGRAGVRLTPDAREVELAWVVAPWRGAWALVNVVLCLALLGGGLRYSERRGV